MEQVALGVRTVYFGGCEVCRSTSRFQAPLFPSTTFHSSFCRISLHSHWHAIIMANDPGFTGRQRLKGEPGFQGNQQLPHPHFQAGENSKFLSEDSSNTIRTEAHPQEAFDQQTFDLGEYCPVSSFFPFSSYTALADRYVVGETQREEAKEIAVGGSRAQQSGKGSRSSS